MTKTITLTTAEIVKSLYALESELIDRAQDLRRLYFENERYFDASRFDGMALDNPLYSYGSQGELSDAFDKEHWYADAPTFEFSLKEAIDYYQKLNHIADCLGYGPGAALRGFNVCAPAGQVWSITSKCLRILNKMKDLTKA